MVIVLQGDAARLPLPDASVDLIVTSPPYFALRSYTDAGEHYDEQIGSEETPAEYIASLLKCTKEWARVLKPGGNMFVNLGDKYCGYTNGQAKGRNLGGGKRGIALVPNGPVSAPAVYGVPNKSLMGLPWRYANRCVDEAGLILRRDIVLRKARPMPEKVRDRCHSVHEYLFHFTLRDRYYSTGKDLAGKMPGSVWEMPCQPLIPPRELRVRHPAPFPIELPRRCILGWSPPGAVVLDPFGGSGTTALVASVLGRIGVTVDRSANYCRLAQWRTADPRQRAKASREPAPRPQKVTAGQQPTLFD